MDRLSAHKKCSAEKMMIFHVYCCGLVGGAKVRERGLEEEDQINHGLIHSYIYAYVVCHVCLVFLFFFLFFLSERNVN